MINKGVLVVLLVFCVGLVSAIDVELVGDTVNVVDAQDLYAYEVNFDYTGDVSDVNFGAFLSQDGKETTSGYLEEDTLTVYESRLDSEQNGVSGSGKLFDVVHTGSLTLKSALFVYANGDEESVIYSTGGDEEEEEEVEEEMEIDGESFSFSPEQLALEIPFGQERFVEVLVYNNGDEDATLQIGTEGLGSTVEIQEEVFVLAGESKSVEIKIKGDRRRALVGRIFFLSEGFPVGEIPVVINTKTDDFLFDVSISLVNLFDSVRQGDNLRAQINLIQLGEREETDVALYYSIKDYAGKNYLDENEGETLAVFGERTVVREFETFRLPAGDYVLGVDVVYDGGFSTTTTQFEIEPGVSFGPIATGLTGKQVRYVGIALLVILVLIIVLVASYFIKKNVQESGNRRRTRKRR